MMIGMFLSFYINHKRIWISLSTRNNQRIMEIGARSYKDRAGFDKEFKHLESVFGKKLKVKN